MDSDSTYHDPTPGVMRIIDAAANRAGEGLRVIEDYLRFVLDDRHLVERCKTLRHDLTAALAPVSLGDRCASREASRDVGAEVTTAGEKSREDVAAVVGASFKRLQQSLRSLEEYTKLLDPAISTALECLRFCTYTLERAVDITRCSIERLETCRLYVLIDSQKTPEQFEALAQSLIAGGADAIQLRDKNLSDGELIQRARLLRRMTRDSDTLLIVNDRPDIAALADADGVHVGQDELSVKDARTIVGPRRLIGVSTHSIEQARRAVLDSYEHIDWGALVHEYMVTPEAERDAYFDQIWKRFAQNAHDALLRVLRARGGLGAVLLERFQHALDRAERYHSITGALGGHQFEIRVAMPGT
ncbi:MAG: thiamine phosphate synthase, partial [Planctomycetes bacterium]|nr:thiamine phosphate synthase [Planctomycetota bacterium]